MMHGHMNVKFVLYACLQTEHSVLKNPKGTLLLTLNGNQYQTCFLKTVKNHNTGDGPLTQRPFDRQECPLHP
jgi:hypothetical protein